VELMDPARRLPERPRIFMAAVLDNPMMRNHLVRERDRSQMGLRLQRE